MAMAIAQNIRNFFRLVDSTQVTRSRVGLGRKRVRSDPDSGIGHTGLHYSDPSCYPGNTFQPTSPQPIRCKRRAGDRVGTISDVGRDVRREEARWGTPRKRALFGPEGQNSISSGSDVAEAQLGWPPDDEFPAVAQSGWPPEDEYLEEARSPRVELVDVVARLQKELAEFRTEFGYGSARRPAIPSQTRVGLDLSRRRCPCMRGSPVGTNVGKCLRLLCVRTDGTESRQRFSLCLTSKTFNVALLVPASQRVLPGVLVGALSEHYDTFGGSAVGASCRMLGVSFQRFLMRLP